MSLSNCYTSWWTVKIDVSCYLNSSSRDVFRILSSIEEGNIFAKLVNIFQSINIFTKCLVSDAWHGPVCLYVAVTEFLHGVHETIWGTKRSLKIKLYGLISTNLYLDTRDVKG